MRKAGRALKLIGGTLLNEADATKEYRNGSERDAIETEEETLRDAITTDQEAETDLLKEAYQILECHQYRIQRATNTLPKAEAYETKLRGSLDREEESQRKQILVSALESVEQSARKSIECEATKRYSFFDSKHKEIVKAILSQKDGFDVELPSLCDENGFDFVIPPSSKKNR